MTEPRFPEYQCHKVVRAARITQVLDVIPDGEHAGKPGLILGWRGKPEDGDETKLFSLLIPVTKAYMDKHQPKVGGYWVIYKNDYGKFSEDSYQSWSPAEPFENGKDYTRVAGT